MYIRVQNFLKGKQKVGNKRKLRNILLSKRRKIQYKRKKFLYAIICSTSLIFLYKKINLLVYMLLSLVSFCFYL